MLLRSCAWHAPMKICCEVALCGNMENCMLQLAMYLLISGALNTSVRYYLSLYHVAYLDLTFLIPQNGTVVHCRVRIVSKTVCRVPKECLLVNVEDSLRISQKLVFSLSYHAYSSFLHDYKQSPGFPPVCFRKPHQRQ